LLDADRLNELTQVQKCWPFVGFWRNFKPGLTASRTAFMQVSTGRVADLVAKCHLARQAAGINGAPRLHDILPPWTLPALKKIGRMFLVKQSNSGLARHKTSMALAKSN